MCMSMQRDELGCAIYNPLLMGYGYHMGVASEAVASAIADCYVYCSSHFLNFENSPCMNLYSGIKRLAHNCKRCI